MENFPVIDLSPYLDDPSNPELQKLCSEVSRTLKETGALLIRDPRCSAEDNDRFLDMMEKYFEQPPEFKRLQERPHLHYQCDVSVGVLFWDLDVCCAACAFSALCQFNYPIPSLKQNSIAFHVGVTPEGVEVPRSLVDEEMQKKLKAMPPQNQPTTPRGPDPKWRYMWRIGPRPSDTRFKELNAEPVIPDGFPEWKETMDSWGSKMISAIEVVAEMAAIGFGLPKDAFTSLMKQGPHLLAPTGSDLRRHGEEGTVFAGYHYDLNFLTIHGRSRFPGLSIWLRNGEKIEWLTAGDCIAGMHEVVVTKRTLEAIRLASEQNRSLWRVSSTLFAHIASDAVLKPLGHFAESPLASKYPPMFAGEYVEKELAVINLKGNATS
ncbi:hypothetical protein Cgig2_028319 [Carnegiea gigantea]|uniref:Non-haem dioxygenase N-terminal domain-containing protein n=1 Tax=Carnegiea gigantea TaxID=171969 RepID=A0A9Q1KKH7_9CARY|nr:hypothetical protein Cgig2_028319 [Carnegiea gigantea]